MAEKLESYFTASCLFSGRSGTRPAYALQPHRRPSARGAWPLEGGFGESGTRGPAGVLKRRAASLWYFRRRSESFAKLEVHTQES
ncbi:uncharacterized [Tachysurus ichikawai]